MIDNKIVEIVEEIIILKEKLENKISHKDDILNLDDPDIYIKETNTLSQNSSKVLELINKLSDAEPNPILRELYYQYVCYLKEEDYLKCHEIKNILSKK